MMQALTLHDYSVVVCECFVCLLKLTSKSLLSVERGRAKVIMCDC